MKESLRAFVFCPADVLAKHHFNSKNTTLTPSKIGSLYVSQSQTSEQLPWSSSSTSKEVLSVYTRNNPKFNSVTSATLEPEHFCAAFHLNFPQKTHKNTEHARVYSRRREFSLQLCLARHEKQSSPKPAPLTISDTNRDNMLLNASFKSVSSPRKDLSVNTFLPVYTGIF